MIQGRGGLDATLLSLYGLCEMIYITIYYMDLVYGCFGSIVDDYYGRYIVCAKIMIDDKVVGCYCFHYGFILKGMLDEFNSLYQIYRTRARLIYSYYSAIGYYYE